MKKFLKGAVVLLIAAAMFFSSVAVTADTTKEQFFPTGISNNKINEKNNGKEIFSHPNIEVMTGPSLFLQPPTPSTEYWYAYTSDYSSYYICVDNFWGVSEPICDLHWWGLSLLYTGGGWEECNPDGMLFTINFYTDSGGVPGSLVCVYTDVSPSHQVYGTYDSYTCYEWSLDLDPCCQLYNGWVSIASSYSPNSCWFLWMNSPVGDNKCIQWGGSPEWKEDDLAFELTGEEVCNPGIDVEKEVWDDKNGEWVDADTEGSAVNAPICSNIQFRIKVTNTGDCPLWVGIDDKMHDSLKYISADPKPEEVTYDPPYYYILWVWPTMVQPGETIIITLTAHVEGPECSIDYNYAYGLGQTDDGQEVEDEDYAYVHAYKKSIEYNTPFLKFLQNFLQNHPYLFPLLQKLIQKLGFGIYNN